MRRLAAAIRVIHPFPTLANALATVLFAAVAVRGLPPLGAAARLALVMFCTQSAIGAANDAVDVELDRRAKPWKPIVRGALSRRQAWGIAFAGAVLAAALGVTFGPAAWALGLAGMACGLAYDLGLKRTPYSVVPYLIALPLLPLWVWTALGRFSPSLLWAYPLGMLIGLSLYLGNTAPDIESDAAAGVRGAAHRLGLVRTLLGAWGALALSIALGVAFAAVSGFRMELLLPAATVAAVCLAAAIGWSLARGTPAAFLQAWGLLIAGALVFGLGWLAAVR